MVDVSPVDGGRIAQITVDERELIVGRDHSDDPISWGIYPTAPWSGRIRRGRFLFQGRWYDLPINFEGHAVHGTSYRDAWAVLDQGPDHLEMGCPLDWHFGGVAHQHIQLTPVALVCVLSVLAGDKAMPATVGWHPWFRKPSTDQLRFEQMYVLDEDHVPTGELVPPAARPWDHCFIGPRSPLQLAYDDGPTITISSDCDHWVVYDEPEHATCVDAKGRICHLGRDFARARDEGAFPVKAMAIADLHDKKGGDPAEWPADLVIRQMPRRLDQERANA